MSRAVSRWVCRASRVTTVPARSRPSMAGASSGISLVLASTSRWARVRALVTWKTDRAADGLAVRGRLLQQARHNGLPGPGAALLALVPGHLRQGSGRAWGSA